VLNGHRSQSGVAPLVLDAQLSTFAIAASRALADGGAPHGYFSSQGSQLFKVGFCGLASENQAPGWPAGSDVNATITSALKAMMDEGPGGGHHDNIVDPRATRVGVGIVVQSNRLYFTNDFSGNCR